MKLEGIREKVFLDRYSLKDKEGKPLEKKPEEMWHRVAKGIAKVEQPKLRKFWENKFYNAMEDFKFVPGGRVLAGAGTGYAVTFYNCFVIPSPQDSRGGILETLKQMVEIMAHGGGVGINLSSLRPRGFRVKKVNGFSSGPCNWAELFSVATKDIIQQGGCFAADTKIMTHSGLVPIEEIVKSKSNYYAATHQGYKKVTAKFDNGIKDIYEVTTSSGFKVKTTLEHRFLTFDKNGKFYQKELADLQEGDDVVQLLGQWQDDLPYVLLQTNLKAPSKYSYGLKDITLPTVLNEDLAFIIGAYDADGSRIKDEFSPHGKGIRIAMADNKPQDLTALIAAIERCINVTPKTRKGDGAVTIVQVFSRRLNEFLKLNGLLKNSSVSVRVPEQIFMSPKKVVEAYIAGVFLGDGTNRGGKGGLRITTVSKEYAQELQLLLVNLGIPSKNKVQLRKEKNWRTTYTITVNGQTFMKRFANLLAPYTQKVTDKKLSVRDGFFGWPFNVVERFSYLANFQRTMARTNPTTSQKSVLFLQQMVPVLQEVDKPDVEFLANCVPDKIASITRVGKENVYDLEVKDVHLLSGNGFYTSNSRRGALMLMLWDWHPDIEEFITVKQDLTRINGANLSVCASDEFMEAVKKNKDWDLVFPDKDDPEYDEKWDGILANWKKMGKKVKVYKTVKARYLWNLICQAAWKSAEPGLVFMERYNKWYNNWYWNTINCVNPCVIGDTLVTVEGGYKKAKDLKVGDKILTPKGFKPVKKFYNNGKKRIYQVTFSDGGTLSATADHKLKVVRKGVYEWVKVTELKKEDNVVKLLFLRTALDERGQSNEDQHKQQQQHYYHHEVLGIKGSNINHNFAFLAKTKLTSQETMVISNQNNTAPQSVLSIPASTGGSTANAKTTCPTSAEMSASFLNSDRVNTNLLKNEDLRFPGMDTSIANLHLAIAQVESVKDTGIYEEVFDVYEPETLTWITNDYVSLDCGEEGLPAWGVCNLASLNLSAFVKPARNASQSDAGGGYSVDNPGVFDFESLAEHARIAVRFQDDVVDADNYVYSEIKEMQLNGERRIGLGTLGLADALIKMHLRYGSDKATKVVDKIYKTIRDAAYDESVNIAKEKGAFPKINIKKHLKGHFIKQLPESVIKKMKKYGVRNSMLLQAAPTGTTSLLSGASSGIEPVYEFEYTHNGRLGKQVVYHSLYGDWKKKNPDKSRPDYFAAANDLTPEDHVKIQAVVQKYVDASISKTVNAPNAHTVEDVKKLYMMAYDMGCKGITYMRDGSRMGVLQRVEDTKKEDLPAGQAGKIAVSEPAIVRRPMMVEGVTYQTKTPVGEAFITINHDEKKEPFEVFITIGKSGSDIAAMAEALGRTISLSLRLTSGLSARERIRQVIAQLAGIGGAGSVGFGKDRVRSLPDAVAKVLARHYNFAVNGKVEDRKPAVVVEEGQKETNGHTNGSAIKNGEIHDQVNVVVMQQLAINGSETDLSSATSLFDICPDCGSGTLAYEEGCKKCYSCGYSAC